MELVQELVLTALIAVLFSYFVAKLVSFAMSGGDSSSDEGLKDVDEAVVMDELLFGVKMNVGVSEGEKRVQFVEETLEKVDKFEEELHQIPKTVGPGSRDQELETELMGLTVVSSEERIVEQEEKANTEDDLFNRTYNKKDVEETAAESGINNDTTVQSEETNVVDNDSKNSLMIEDDDEWEGIERSELEKVFGAAEKFVASGVKDNLLSDVQMELYALHKVATEGPCRDSQPMALMLSARSKWNAWQKLGNMSPEEAMEQYVTLLSDRVPGWMEENYSGDGKLGEQAAGKADALAPQDLSSFSGHQTDCEYEKNPELKSGGGGGEPTRGSSLESTVKE
ncbi:putative Acyl-CoA-binding domain 3 [Melia azedarach]|uniref:Acyl-CoA-binding domain 3 n=1 Tax=Melia azedarach TaxID=155640 RepID=A0ACC1WR27_MELAZ|nr:putative Acyl-CoA-binding domain 3 [Melia azedarach]